MAIMDAITPHNLDCKDGYGIKWSATEIAFHGVRMKKEKG
jgi:hypothetical protein